MKPSIGKVLFVAPSAYSLGGVAVWLDYLLPILDRFGIEVSLGLAQGVLQDTEKYLEFYPGLQKYAFAIPNPTGSRAGRLNALINAFRRVQPDIILVVNIADAYEACRLYKKTARNPPRLVTTLHGLEQDLLSDIQRESDVIDAVICTNRLTQLAVNEFAGIPSERVLYAPYGVELGAARQVKENAELVIGYSGRFESAQKRVLDLQPIMLSLRDKGVDWRLLLAGSGPDEGRLRQAFSAPEFNNRVEFLGFVKPEEMRQVFYDRCDALLITSSWETGPIVAWEAMAAGVPVVSSQYVGCGVEGALLHERNCLLYPVGDVDEAARCLGRLVDRTLGDRLREGGLALVESRYTRAVSAEQWAEQLHEVLRLPKKDGTMGSRPIEPAGRLDKLLGVQLGERVRRLLGLRHLHADPGGEWPHSHSSSKGTPQLLLELARYERERALLQS